MFGLSVYQLVLLGGAGVMLVLFAAPYFGKLKALLPTRTPAVADDIPDLIAAAKLAQSVGCQKGVDAMLGVVAERLRVSGNNPVPAEVK